MPREGARSGDLLGPRGAGDLQARRSHGPGVFVLGAGRSGTSLVTRMINFLGVSLNRPEDWLTSSEENPKGFWESRSLLEINDQLLAALGGRWSAPPPLPTGWERAADLQPLRDQARACFGEVFPTSPWVWKDPRNCLTFPFWALVSGARPIIVVPYRNPLDVAASLGKHAGLTKRHGLALWERKVRQVLSTISGLPTVITPYEELVGDPWRWCDRMRSFLMACGLELSEDPLPREALEFPETGLRHHRHQRADLDRDPEVSAEQSQLYRLLDAFRGPHDAFSTPDLPPETAWTEPVLAEHRALFQAGIDRFQVADLRASLEGERATFLEERRTWEQRRNDHEQQSLAWQAERGEAQRRIDEIEARLRTYRLLDPLGLIPAVHGAAVRVRARLKGRGR